MTIELYSHPMSPCSQKIRIILAEKGLAWEKIDLNLAVKENLKPEYLALNPLGVVPTLVDGGAPVIESSIISEYLEDCYPSPSLRPTAPLAISTMRFWMKHIDNKVHPACGALQWPLVMTDKLGLLSPAEQDEIIDRVIEKPRRERQRRLLKMGYDAPDIADAVATYEATIVNMEKKLADSGWLAGHDFSLADAGMAPYFQTLSQFGWSAWYESRANVADWFERCRSRTSYQTGVAADFDEEKRADLLARGAPAWQKIQTLLE